METLSVNNKYLIFQRAAHKLRAVNNKLRQKLIDLLRERKEMTVTAIYIELRMEQSVASQHLGVLQRRSFGNAY